MSKNYFIGIGGSGSKVLESIGYLCATGMGPDNLTAIIIDPDESNANVSRTSNLLSTYEYLRNLEIDNKNIFHTNLYPQEKGNWQWSYSVGDKDNKLSEILEEPKLDTGGDDLRKLFITKQELNLPLSEGFRGHPLIGSTIFGLTNIFNEVKNEKSSLGYLVTSIENNLAHEKCNLFISGSIFGGTGASGIPTIAKKILHYLKEKKCSIENLYIGGLLITPYFTLPRAQNKNGSDHDEGEKEKIHAKARFFDLNTVSVLENYDILVRGLYDYIYTLGESDARVMYKEFQLGGSKQENRSFYLDLVGALTAFDFYNMELKKNEKNPILNFTARSGKDKKDNYIDWDTFYKFAIDRNQLKENLLKFIKFSIAYHGYFQKGLEKELKSRSLLSIIPGESAPAWFKQHFSKKEFRQKEEDEILETFSSFMLGSTENKKGYGFINWLDDILNFKAENFEIRLINNNIKRCTNFANIEYEESSGGHEADFNELVESFIKQPTPNELKGSTKFLHILYRSIVETHHQTA